MKSIGLLIAAGILVAQAPAARTAEPSEEFDAVVRGMRAEREKLKGGVVRIKGTEGLDHLEKANRNRSEPFEIFVAFDGERLRFDTSEMGYVLNPDSGAEMRAPIERKYVRTESKIGTWSSGRRARAGDDPPPIGRGELFDVRTLGMRGWIGRHLSLDDTLAALATHPWVKSVDRSDPLRVWLTLRSTGPTVRSGQFRISISPDQGYSATRNEYLSRDAPDAPWKLTRQSNTVWREVAGTWLPVHHAWSLYYSDKRRRFLDFDLEWESVNQPVDPKWFEIESLGPEAKVESVDG